MRPIDSEQAYAFLTDQLVKETGAFSKGVNKGLNVARSAIRNPDAIPTIIPPIEWISVEDGKPKTPVNKKGYLCQCIINDAEEYQVYMVLSYIAVDKNPHFQHEGANMRVTHWAEFNGIVENEKEEKMK